MSNRSLAVLERLLTADPAPPPERIRLHIILTSMPVVIRAGVEIDYRISLYGLPMPWRSRIDVWEPGVRFVDRQLLGPYRWWRHEHRFEAAAGETMVIDDVEYLPRARWLSAGRVRRDLDRIFTFRQETLRSVFG